MRNSIVTAMVFENRPVFELVAEENRSERELMESMHFDSFEAGLQEALGLAPPPSLLNHVPYFARFIVVAKTSHNERYKVTRNVDLMMWADNVPIHYCRPGLLEKSIGVA